MNSIAHVEDKKKELTNDVHRLAYLGVRLVDSDKGGVLVYNGSRSSLVADVKENREKDPILVELEKQVAKKNIEVFSQRGDEVLHYQGRLCVFDVEGLRKKIFSKTNNSRYSIHLRSTKMNRELRKV